MMIALLTLLALIGCVVMSAAFHSVVTMQSVTHSPIGQLVYVLRALQEIQL